VIKTLLTACVVLIGFGPVFAQVAGDEQRLKAAFVLRFPQFVAWPAPALAGRTTLDICVDPPGATASALREITAGESLNGKQLVVRAAPPARELASCHVLVLAGSRPDRALLSRAAALPILTVGEGDSFLDLGGIIQLKMVDRRVRFDINLQAASRAGVTLSSQLLRLATNVRGER